MAICPACGFWIPDGQTICYQCGYRLSDEDEDEYTLYLSKPKSKTKENKTFEWICGISFIILIILVNLMK